MVKYAILANQSFDYLLSKTGNMLIRYKPEEVAVIIDSSNAGRSSNNVLGWGKNIPIVSCFQDAKVYSPTHLVLGNAPQGGRIDQSGIFEIKQAIKSGCHIISGMHQFLIDDDEIRLLAKKNNVNLIDLRMPPIVDHFPQGSWKNRKFPVLLVAGSDCDTGKMTTAWELYNLLKNKGIRAEFLATGQTGIFLSGKGIPIDAVKADFMSGEIEHCLDELYYQTELVVVEGQGALNNMFYSGVTLGLLHGCMPDYLILTHELGRELDVSNHPIPKLSVIMQMYIDLLKPFKESKFLGINLLSFVKNNEEAICEIKKLESMMKMPVTDLIRFGDRGIIRNIINALSEWR